MPLRTTSRIRGPTFTAMSRRTGRAAFHGNLRTLGMPRRLPALLLRITPAAYRRRDTRLPQDQPALRPALREGTRHGQPHPLAQRPALLARQGLPDPVVLGGPRFHHLRDGRTRVRARFPSLGAVLPAGGFSGAPTSTTTRGTRNTKRCPMSNRRGTTTTSSASISNPGMRTPSTRWCCTAPAGNTSKQVRRRGYTVRYTGDDVIYSSHPGTNRALRNSLLKDGEPAGQRSVSAGVGTLTATSPAARPAPPA